MAFIQINTRFFNMIFFLIKYRKQFDDNFFFHVLFYSERGDYVTLVENHLFNCYWLLLLSSIMAYYRWFIFSCFINLW